MPKTHGDGTPCPECGSVNTVRNGNIKNGRGTIARRRCNACKHTWYPTRQKRACKCGLLGCDCGGNIGRAGGGITNMDKEFELKLTDASGKSKTAVWTGTTGEDACKRYAASHPGVTVHAWRNYPRYGVFVLGRNTRIIE